MKYFLLILITAGIISCKEELRENTPCFASDKDTTITGDSILFTNCSVADTAIIVITEIGNEQQYIGPAHNFTMDSVYITMNDTGNFRATLRTWNMEQNSEMKESYISFRVN